MTCGIYKLNFANTNEVYIGQSENIESRYTIHLNHLHKETHSVKLNNAYLLFGKPELEILLDCDKDELDMLEELAISLWNSVDKGFNTSSKASGGVSLGENNGNSVYTNQQIIETFNMLVDTKEISFKDISSVTKVSTDTIKQISRGINHKWLAKEFPEKYKILLSLKGTRASFSNSAQGIGKQYPDIISPDGIIYKITNGKAFANEHGLQQSNLYQVLKGYRKSHKGWKLK